VPIRAAVTEVFPVPAAPQRTKKSKASFSSIKPPLHLELCLVLQLDERSEENRKLFLIPYQIGFKMVKLVR